MSELVFEVKYKNPPREGKKQWTVKTAKDEMIGFDAKMQGLMQVGGTYKGFVEEREWQGKTYLTLKTVNPVTQTEVAADKVLATVAANVRDDRGPKSWVCHLVGQTIAAGFLNPVEASRVEMAELVLKFYELERLNPNKELQSPQTKAHPDSAGEMNDDLPY